MNLLVFLFFIQSFSLRNKMSLSSIKRKIIKYENILKNSLKTK